MNKTLTIETQLEIAVFHWSILNEYDEWEIKGLLTDTPTLHLEPFEDLEKYLHNEDGPAYIHKGNATGHYYYIYGKEMTEAEWNAYKFNNKLQKVIE